MSQESAPLFKRTAEREPAPTIERFEASNDNLEYPAPNDNFEEIEAEKLDKVRENLGIHSGETSHEENVPGNENSEKHEEHSAEHEHSPAKDDHGSEGDGHGGGTGGSGTTSGGGHGGGRGNGLWHQAKKEARHFVEGHGDFWSSPAGNILVKFLTFGYFIMDFLKNTNWGDAFKTKGGGGGGKSHGGGHGGGHDDHGHGGGGGGHH